jgi:hypothetical protein
MWTKTMDRAAWDVGEHRDSVKVAVRHRNGTGNREQDGDQYRGADQDRRVPRRPMCTAAGPRRGATRMVAGIFTSLAEYERELIYERAAVARQADRPPPRADPGSGSHSPANAGGGASVCHLHRMASLAASVVGLGK